MKFILKGYLIICLIQFIFFNLIYLYAQKRKNNGLVDIAWPISFIISAITSFLLKNQGDLNILITSLVTIHSLRLAIHLFKRNFRSEEDYRYKEMREKFKDKFYLKMYLIYMMQMLLSLIISLPFTYANLRERNYFNKLFVLFLIFWIIGFFMQSIADYQLKRFIKEGGRGKIMDKGLWSISRHPNYFAESLMAFSIFLLCLNSTFDLIFIISPITITFFILKVSGVPMLEKKMQSREGWQEYKNKTSCFLPRISKLFKE